MGTPELIGQRIKRERLAADLTQRELADAVGVGVPHISKVEAGRESPSDDLLVKLAQQFSVSVDELMLAARRLPEDLLEELASDPKQSLEFLRTWKQNR